MGTVMIRPMEEKEVPFVQEMGKRAFIGMERWMIGKPKKALVAEVDGQLAGAVMYKLMKAGGKRIGYIDFAFVDPDRHNRGIGTTLYGAAVEYLWTQEDCDALTALVKDDNIGSWGLFLKNGFARLSLPELVRQFGLGGALKQYFGVPFCLGIGMEYYVALRGKVCPSGKRGSAGQITAYLLANALLFLVALASRMQHAFAFAAAYFALLLGGIAAGFVGTRFSGRNWRFRHINGGALTCALVNLTALFPMVGNWYPAHYEKTREFRKDMGMVALSDWLFMLVMTAIAAFGGLSHVVFQFAGQIGAMFLIYRMIPFYPFESYGGRRVLDWSMPVYAVMMICSLAVVVASFLRL